MKYPKNWNKLKISDQERWLVNKLLELHNEEDELRQQLAKVRGGHKIQITDIDRPDEALLKSN